MSVGVSVQLNNHASGTGEDCTVDVTCTEDTIIDVEVSSPHTPQFVLLNTEQDKWNSKAINSLAVSLRSNLHYLQDFLIYAEIKLLLQLLMTALDQLYTL